MKSEINKNIKQLVKAELSYNLSFITGLGIFFVGYTFITIGDAELFSETKVDIDFWGALFSLFFYMLIYSMWIVRLKEKRIRLHSTLPITQKTHAVSRMLYIISIIVMSFLYISLQLFLLPSWSEETGGILAHLGLVFIVFALFIIGRDQWFVYSNRKFMYTLLLIVTLAVLLSLSALIFIYLRPFLYDISGAYAGRAVFAIWASLLMAGTTYTFTKRKQFLK